MLTRRAIVQRPGTGSQVPQSRQKLLVLELQTQMSCGVVYCGTFGRGSKLGPVNSPIRLLILEIRVSFSNGSPINPTLPSLPYCHCRLSLVAPSPPSPPVSLALAETSLQRAARDMGQDQTTARTRDAVRAVPQSPQVALLAPSSISKTVFAPPPCLEGEVYNDTMPPPTYAMLPHRIASHWERSSAEECNQRDHRPLFLPWIISHGCTVVSFLFI
ncbi:hypothetical protein B0T17DRAFT_286334 [Bombardia bombarda]|uniref:Uncharacterized protein n=1 Tax=Bombardia bombarda TaxID=252184 RepID=A0AA39WTL5_9PEZI|nr:hypothetical protein B0T17DRAFT_286334 [Bombardia bombarda]